jgi:hypothetical protein
LKQKTILYTRYVNYIVIIYDTKRTHSYLINTYINQIHTDIKLRHTYENNGCISFLCLLIILKPSSLETDIFRKTNTTDTTINFLSNHPIKHKVAAVRHYITRMHSLLLTSKRKQIEWTLIKLIAQNNFPQKLLQNLNFQTQYKQTNHDKINKRNKNKTWTTFTYYSPIIRIINNLFKHTGVEISLNNTNILQQLTNKNNQ